MPRTSLIFLFGALCAVPGCADKIGHAKPDGGGDGVPAARVQTARVIDGSFTTIIDSTSETGWTYVDFETGQEAAATDAWDLRFQRFHLSTNGGVSGTGGVEVAPVAGPSFTDVTAAPASGYLSDAADSDGNMVPEYAFEQGDDRWYDYDVQTHVLRPKPVVWVVKTDGGSTLKLEILKYYDAAGTAGWFMLHWRTM